MMRLKKKFGTLFFIFLLSPAIWLHAEATIELFGDFGFMVPPQPLLFGNANIAVINDPAAPEGKNILQLGIANGGGWGISNPFGGNLTGYSGGALRFWMKSTIQMTIEIEHTSPGTKSTALLNSTGGQWREFVLTLDGPNRSFTRDVNLNNVISMFLANNFTSASVHNIYFDDIRWTKAISALVVHPPHVTVNPGAHRQFTVEGISVVTAEPIFLYSIFTNAGAVGGFTPFNPLAPSAVGSSMFTAGTTSGSVPFSETSFSTATFVNITTQYIDKEFGILSETVPGLQLGVDSYFGVSQGPRGTVVVSNSTSDKREGNQSTVVSLNIPVDSFGGIYIQEDLSASNFFTRDMSDFFDGSLRFWLKAPPALQNVMQVSIRSGNVLEQREASMVSLQNYVSFDNAWHPVVIPLRDFAGPRPKADLSRIKIFVSFFAVGNTSGPQNIFIDNVRWDTRTPGPLSQLILSPNPIQAPLGSSRFIQARGLDSSGNSVDIFPTWNITGNIGVLSNAQGTFNLLQTTMTPTAGQITVTENALSTSTLVSVADPIWTQSFNVYSDVGSGGFVGLARNPAALISLSELNLGASAPEGQNVRHAIYSLTPGGFAVWFTNVDNANGTQFMEGYEDGYLSFWVRSRNDLEVSLRSGNIPAGTERSKIRLSEMGIPLNNSFQRVVVPMDEFRRREPRLDFSQIQTYFAIGAIESQIGSVGNQFFDVDEVQWLTASNSVVDINRVYSGILEKQQPSGLVRSFENQPDAFTYDQALAALAYQYHLDFNRARSIFNVYQAKFNAGGFAGFENNFDVTSPATILDSDRVAGPNAWMLLALLHHRTVTGDLRYDSMMDGLANWLRSLQDVDGAIRFGFSSTVNPNEKSTEHALDCYAAFQRYADIRNNSAFRGSADQIRSWLDTEVYEPTERRFRVGEHFTGLPNTDRALDVYSWAPLALSSYTLVLTQAVLDLGTTQVCDLTGRTVAGFDFSGPINGPVDRDSVWLEGTGHMAVAYYFTGQSSLGDFYLNQLDRAIVNTSPTGQGMAYATNVGTAYGFTMNSTNPSLSSICWYLFAKRKFNPFQSAGLFGIQLKNISNNQPAASLGFSVTPPVEWIRSNQMIELSAQPISFAPWGVQIYTNNTSPNSVPRFFDPSPLVSSNLDSDPAGLGWLLSGLSSTTARLPLAWRIQDGASPLPNATAPFTPLTGGTGEAFNWFFMKDKATPAIDFNGNGVLGEPEDGTAFQNGEDFIRVRSQQGIHSSQGPAGYSSGFSPDYIFLEANFSEALPQETYQSNTLSLEFFFE